MDNCEDDRTNACDVWLRASFGGFKTLPSRHQAQVLMSLINSCDPSARYQLLKLCNEALHCDLISLLPPELVENIMGLLDAHDLMMACKVSRKWNEQLSQSSSLWKKQWVNLGLGNSSNLNRCESQKWKSECVGGLKLKEMMARHQALECYTPVISDSSVISAMDYCNGEIVVCSRGPVGATLYKVDHDQWINLCSFPLNRHGFTMCVRLLPGGHIVAGSSSGKITIWKFIRHGATPLSRDCKVDLLHDRLGHAGVILCVDGDEPSQVAVSGSRDKVVKLWSIGTGECLKLFNFTSGVDLLQVSLMFGKISPLKGCNFLIVHGGTTVFFVFWDVRSSTANDNNWLKCIPDIICPLISPPNKSILPGVSVCDGKLVYLQSSHTVAHTELVIQPCNFESIVMCPLLPKLEQNTVFTVDTKVLKLLKVGLRHALLVCTNYLMAVDLLTGKELFKHPIQYSIATSPVLPHITVGSSKWLNGLINANPGDIVVAVGANEISATTWALNIPKFRTKQD